MPTNTAVSPRVFTAIQNVHIKELSTCSQKEIRPILPCLVRMSLISPLDITKECAEGRKEILTILSGIELVNSIVALLSIDFHALETDVRKEQQLRQKLGSVQSDSILAQSLQSGLALEFERSDSTRRLRLVLSEILFIASQIQELQRNQEFQIKQSDLFDNAVYMEEISDVICIALAELPALLSILDIAETLLHVKHGPEIICWIVANSPDSFAEVCAHLIANGERQEESALGRIRTQALTMLCQMNPSQALAVRAKCVELCRMPALAITLSLEHENIDNLQPESDMVAFVSGLLLGNDQQVRTWIAMFVRNGQKRKWESHTALQSLREELLRRLKAITSHSSDSQLAESYVVQASALLRLYCALRGIGGIKFQDDEVVMIVQLLTSHPPPSPAGVRFVSLGLCMLIACPSLIGHSNLEKRSIEWVQWLVREEVYFESTSGVSASFGEMLLLMAIHFHSNQLSAICELVCATLGMKIPIRPNNLTRMKQIFTQEIFTEQVVTSHAVKVPVTANLSANIPGFLPVHCIHQLLKSRAFAKHKVPIKNWIYRQICDSVPPLHPVLPALVEVYVNSILVTTNKTSEHTNKPITEDEIRRVFQNSVFGANFDPKKSVLNIADMENDYMDVDTSKPSLTSQLLLLYYLLLYEDVRLSNMHNFISQGKKVKSYSTEFLSELPIKYLLQQVQRDQMSYAGLFSPLLRLLATHFPHLSLVDDWLDEEMINIDSMTANYDNVVINDVAIIEAFGHIETCPSRTGRLLRQLIDMKPTDIWPHAETIIHFFKAILDNKVPRYIQELYKQVWLRLNTVLPRCLWVLSINALIIENTMVRNVFLTQENIVLDPLQVLRCHTRVFRCAPVLSVILRILQATLAASRSQLSRHMQDRPLTEKIGQLTSEAEREDLRTALVAGQESAAVQILLEACLETEEDRQVPGQMWSLREIRSVVCSYLHQVFIADPSLAKLVHFQGYPRELLPITVSGIPSMHICLDWIPELLSQPEPEKQVFAVDLASHLAVQYALPKALSVSRLAINTLATLLGVLPAKGRVLLFMPVLPALTRICLAFPPLAEDTTALLLQLGRVSVAQAALGDKSAEILCREVNKTFAALLQKAILQSRVF
ncbi:integrator complex subunit 2 isoform X1 [Neodiprion virginianus]|uniref:Integrator complex subunit 2 isoform X1 n=1 Tax=Neodiprion lecontei TaxID=441921 RepID=A0A6J0BVL8_NEOLC|nr:integrator complex subunit 2 isoform X1 [Neodiprion lecontei]XP_046417757.1 integrator complex subunit 2 isoform X1 [Neodiprion fabricii]XP_046610580.1 integrator complex subunit 2 isoform X1 [Neodiprion virginianus]